MDVTIIPTDDAHAADLARALLAAAGPDRAHLVRTRSDVPGGLGFVVPAALAATIGEATAEPAPAQPDNQPPPAAAEAMSSSTTDTANQLSQPDHERPVSKTRNVTTRRSRHG